MFTGLAGVAMGRHPPVSQHHTLAFQSSQTGHIYALPAPPAGAASVRLRHTPQLHHDGQIVHTVTLPPMRRLPKTPCWCHRQTPPPAPLPASPLGAPPALLLLPHPMSHAALNSHDPNTPCCTLQPCHAQHPPSAELGQPSPVLLLRLLLLLSYQEPLFCHTVPAAARIYVPASAGR